MQMMIYHAMTDDPAIIGDIEEVWGHKMLVAIIDASDAVQVEQAKSDGWHDSPQAVIELIKNQDVITENVQLKDKVMIKQLQDDLKNKDAEIAVLKEHLAKYESNATADFGKMTADEIKAYLDEKGIEYPSRIAKDELVKLAQGN